MSARVPLYVFGAGGHGKVVAEAARESSRFELRGFLDEDDARWGERWFGLPVIGGLGALDGLDADTEVALALGRNHARATIAEVITSHGRRLATIVHPTAVIASGAVVGEGTYVGPLALLHSDARVGRGCIVNSGAIVEHDCLLGDWVHVSPRAALGGGVHVGDGAHVGLGAVLLPGLVLGPWATLGAGAVMVKSLPGRVTAVGVPASVRTTAGRNV